MQKRIIEQQFECFKCHVERNGMYMTCKGVLQPLDYLQPYKLEIYQEAGLAPKVYVISPTVAYNPKIHMYKAGHLCLFYPPDMDWKSNTSVAAYTIPWVNEWIVYYELYKISGEWEGPAAPHGINE